MEGIVIKSTGSWYIVRSQTGEQYECKTRGKIRLEGRRTTNPIAVGDTVTVDISGSTPVITTVAERKNYIIRRATNLSKESHIIASNLDQALLVVTVINPKLKRGFADRFLATTEAYRIPTVIVFNKADTYTEKAKIQLKSLQKIYEKIGYQTLVTSATDGRDLEEFKNILVGKTTLVSGQSGVGKSSLVNAVDSNLTLRIGATSDANDKGSHTTTFAEMHPLAGGGYVVDTPGLRNFGLIDIEREELGHFFPEIAARMQDCQFNNCIHLNEPNCAVLKALAAGEIDAKRYENYLMMLDEIKDGKVW